MGLDPWVDLLLTSEEARIAKPDPTIFALALERAQVDAPNAVMVGDNWRNDVEGAVSAGIRAVWFDRWGQPAPPRPPRVAVVRTLAPAGPLVDLLLDATPPRRAPAA